MSTPATQELSFEKALENLAANVKRLEAGDLSLEQSIELFEQGVKLSKLCQEQLGAAEQKVEILMKSAAGEPELKPFPQNR